MSYAIDNSAPSAPREAHMNRINDRVSELCARFSDTHNVLQQRATSIFGPVPTPIGDGKNQAGEKEPPMLRRIEMGLARLNELAQQFEEISRRFDQL